MNEDAYTIKVGHLKVAGGHSLYYQTWGNPKGVPVMVLHGGPGYQSKDKHKLAFDPKKHCVIFHDQRGNGQSTSDHPLEHNTTKDLIEDIERLRTHLKLKNVNIFGFSWGSTLALYYAIMYPSSVEKMLIGGVYTGTKTETDNLYQGGFANMVPDAWERFIEIIPPERRSDTLAYYEEVFTKGTRKEKIEHLRHWAQLESTPHSIDADYADVRQSADSIMDLDDLPNVLTALHYFRSGCFLPERFILDNLKTISHIPTVIVQGRFDVACQPGIAKAVADGIGENAHLHFVPNSHKTEGALREVQRAYAWAFF